MTAKDADVVGILKTKSVLAGLPDAILLDLIGKARRVSYAKGASVYLRGDVGDSLLVLLKGRVKISNVSASAREVVLNILATGDLVGELGVLDGEPRSADATALEASEGLLLYRRDILPALEANPKALLGVIGALSKKLRQLSALAEYNLLHMAGRAASGLLLLAQQHGREVADGILIDVKLSQRDLGNYVGLSRENTSRELGRLKDEGLIRMDGALITILDLEGLEACADVDGD